VGTVLAYYFSRDNFVTASDSTHQLVRDFREEKLRSTRVSEVMIKTIFSQSDLQAKVEDVLKSLSEKNTNGYSF